MISIGSLSFLSPYMFALIIPVIVFSLWPKKQKPKSPKLFWPGILPGQDAFKVASNKAHWLSRALTLLSALALTVSAANPVILGAQSQDELDARDLMLAVDISQSMERADLELNNRPAQRVEVVKAVVSDFAERRVGDRLGLILFGSQAYLQAPLTFDRETLKKLLLEAQLGFAGPKTAIGDAIGVAIKRLQERPNDERTLILLTDGANTAGTMTPIKAAQLAATAGIKVYTIGVGASSMMQQGIFGTSFGARTINPSAELDEATLTKIAELTGGKYFRAYSTADLVEVYETLDELEPAPQPKPGVRPYRSIAYILIVFALLALSLSALLRRAN